MLFCPRSINAACAGCVGKTLNLCASTAQGAGNQPKDRVSLKLALELAGDGNTPLGSGGVKPSTTETAPCVNYLSVRWSESSEC